VIGDRVFDTEAIGDTVFDTEYCHWRQILVSSLLPRKQKATHGISSSRFSMCKEIQNYSISKKSHAHHLLGCKRRALHGISD
jgi:hypothetical protein